MTDITTDDLRVVLSTCGNQQEAEHIAHALVESQLAACVNILPGAHSVYRWQGKVESAQEVLLLIKTSAQYLERVQNAITALHSYELPEIMAVKVSGGSESYLGWLLGNLK